MIAEFILFNPLLAIILITLVETVFVVLAVQEKKTIYGLIALVLFIGFAFASFQAASILDENAEAFCLDEGLEFHHRINMNSKIACYETTNDSVEIITFEELNGKMYRLSDSIESDEVE